MYLTPTQQTAPRNKEQSNAVSPTQIKTLEQIRSDCPALFFLIFHNLFEYSSVQIPCHQTHPTTKSHQLAETVQVGTECLETTFLNKEWWKCLLRAFLFSALLRIKSSLLSVLPSTPCLSKNFALFASSSSSLELLSPVLRVKSSTAASWANLQREQLTYTDTSP